MPSAFCSLSCSLKVKLEGVYFMRAGYSWIAPLNLSWISQMNSAVDFNPRDAMIVVLKVTCYVC